MIVNKNACLVLTLKFSLLFFFQNGKLMGDR